MSLKIFFFSHGENIWTVSVVLKPNPFYEKSSYRGKTPIGNPRGFQLFRQPRDNDM